MEQGLPLRRDVADEVKVLAQATCNKRPEECGPKECFPPPALTARWGSYLNRKLQDKAPCRDYLGRVPITSTDVPFCHSFLRRYIEDEALPRQGEPPTKRTQKQRAQHLRDL